MRLIKELLDEAEKTYLQNFPNTAYYGRCIFLSWYCDNAGCKFCYRSTQKDRIRFAGHARRTPWSIITEVLLCKALGWKIEFLTGGYKILPFQELVAIAKLVAEIYGQKIWINLGALEKEELKQLLPYIGGVTASIETINPELHDKVCPKKPLAPYERLLEYAGEFKLKKSITVIIGLGETETDFELLKTFITKHKLDRITFYPLKPVKGTSYTKGPSSENYVWWIAKTRVAFPNLEIIAGTTLNRIKNVISPILKNIKPSLSGNKVSGLFFPPLTSVRGGKNNSALLSRNGNYPLVEFGGSSIIANNEISLLMKAGANAITKFPATKKFGSEEAHIIEKQIKNAGRKFEGTLSKMPANINWDKMIEGVNVKEEWKKKVEKKIEEYLERLKKSQPF